MDLNMVVICGRVVGPPEIEVYESGACRMVLLVAVRSSHPRTRIDVVPVTWWDPPGDRRTDWEAGTRVWIAGSIQRRFSAAADGRRSRLEVIAIAVNALPASTEAPVA
jgi:single-stranded DNA-binding protein